MYRFKKITSRRRIRRMNKHCKDVENYFQTKERR